MMATWERPDRRQDVSLDTRAFDAAMEGKADVLKRLLDMGAGPNTACYAYGDCVKTALHVSCDLNRIGCVELLLERGADVNTIEPASGFTALHFACKKGHVRIVNILLGIPLIDLWTLCKHHMGSKRASQLAKENGCISLAEMIEDREETEILEWAKGSSSSSRSSSSSSSNTLSRLSRAIAAGGNIFAQSKPLDWTALHVATHHNCSEAVSILITASLNHHADGMHTSSMGGIINAVSSSGQTPLSMACQLGRVHIVQLLLSAGADYNVEDHQGITPLFYTVMGLGDFDSCLLALVGAGASLCTRDSPDRDNRMVFHAACKRDRTRCVALLLGLDEARSRRRQQQQQQHEHEHDYYEQEIYAKARLRLHVDHGVMMMATAMNGGGGGGTTEKLLNNPNMMYIDTSYEHTFQAGVHDVCSKGYTGLHYAAENGSLGSIRLILHALGGGGGGRVGHNTTDAATDDDDSSSVSSLSLLLYRTNRGGATAFDLAKLNGHDECCMELLGRMS